ncbi:hypothetical protein QOZ80_3AG0223100 [Eleusine coracana subsp. coracana]|nr:hypothetical protein QOZ80_3AG0223100 [Eleusine coracana subsp. coracana]
MRPPLPSFLYVSALLIAFILLCGVETVEGQPSKWCREAHEKDPRINYKFCYDEFMAHSKNSDWEDPWRMAKVSAWCGADNGKFAIKYIQTHLGKPETDPKVKTALQECHELYDKVEDAFLRAGNKIDSRSQGYAGARTEVALAASLAQQCEYAFAKVGVPSQFHESFVHNEQMGYICLALISIIGH